MLTMIVIFSLSVTMFTSAAIYYLLTDAEFTSRKTVIYASLLETDKEAMTEPIFKNFHKDDYSDLSYDVIA